MHPRAPPHDRLSDLGAGADQVLAVIQHDQHILGGQGIQHGLQDRPARWPGNPQRPGNRRRHTVLVLHRGQFHQPHPITPAIKQPGRHLQTQPGLA
jgi:hypothetical protein